MYEIRLSNGQSFHVKTFQLDNGFVRFIPRKAFNLIMSGGLLSSEAKWVEDKEFESSEELILPGQRITLIRGIAK